MNDTPPAPLPIGAEAAELMLRAWSERAPGLPPPRLAIVLGSGWDAVAQDMALPGCEIAYATLPGFPRSAVPGHAGRLALGMLAGVPVALLRGRAHLYERGRADAMRSAIEALARFGCRTLLLTNAAGSLQPAMGPGSLMLIADHLDMVQCNPLEGESATSRFVDMNDAYAAPLRQLIRKAAQTASLPLHEGVYAFMRGPQFETPAEIRMLQTLGAQAVGMSTVPETILARHAGLKVAGLSMITNLAAGLSHEPLSHAQTLAAAAHGAGAARSMLHAVVPALAGALADV